MVSISLAGAFAGFSAVEPSSTLAGDWASAPSLEATSIFPTTLGPESSTFLRSIKVSVSSSLLMLTPLFSEPS